jgi:membrane fusion protein (multidrug efflux system)
LLVVGALFLAWAGWFLFARVSLYEVTDAARLEVDREAHPVQAPVSGRVTATRLALGREVQASDPLVELDAKPQHLELEEKETQHAVLEPQLRALRDELSAEEKAWREERQAATTGLDEARARLREAEAAARFAQDRAERLSSLLSAGLLSDIEFLRGKAEAQEQRAVADSLQLALSRMEQEERTRQSDRQAHIEELKREINQLTGEKATTGASVETLQHEVERRRIFAPIPGRLGDIANLRVGGYVREGDRLAAIIPVGTLKIAASFPPAAALGRIRPGQRARLRLEGFPWAQYGSIPATVSSVASEVRDGRLRVDLLLSPNHLSAIPLQHGLPGTVEVEVEQVSSCACAARRRTTCFHAANESHVFRRGPVTPSEFALSDSGSEKNETQIEQSAESACS